MNEYRAIGTAGERQQEERQAVRDETTAMSAAFDVLQPLGEEARHRAIRWLAMALDLSPRVPF